MTKLAVKCPLCGRNLEPIGDVIKNPKDPNKVCCKNCRKVWLPHELEGPAGSYFKKDVQVSDEGVPW